MTETRAVMRSPQLDIEIDHHRAVDEAAEYLSIHITARPTLGSGAGMFDPLAMMQWWAQGDHGPRYPFVWAPWMYWMRVMMTPLIVQREAATMLSGQPGETDVNDH